MYQIGAMVCTMQTTCLNTKGGKYQIYKSLAKINKFYFLFKKELASLELILNNKYFKFNKLHQQMLVYIKINLI